MIMVYFQINETLLSTNCGQSPLSLNFSVSLFADMKICLEVPLTFCMHMYMQINLLNENPADCFVVLSTGQIDVCLLTSLFVSLLSEWSDSSYWNFSEILDLTLLSYDLGAWKLELADKWEPPFWKPFWNGWGRNRLVDLACRQGPRFTANGLLVVDTKKNVTLQKS